MNLRTRILLCFAALTAAAVCLGAVDVWFYLRGQPTMDRAASAVLLHTSHLRQAHNLIERIQATILDALLAPPEQRTQSLRALDQHSVAFYGVLEEMADADSEERAAEPLLRAFQAYYFLAKQALELGDLRTLRDTPEVWDHFLARKTQLADRLEEYLVGHLASAREGVAQSRGQLRTLTLLSVLVALASLLVTLAAAAAVGRLFSHPLGNLVAAARRIAAGDLEHRVNLRRRDELGTLAGAFDHMAGQLAQRQQQLVQNREQLEATVVQRTTELTDSNRRLSLEVEERIRAEAQLLRLNETLEQRVADRTQALEQANRKLAADIAAVRAAEERSARLEKELRRSRTLEAMGRLAGGVAHDFNNLLGGVLGCLYSARLQGRDPESTGEDLDRAQELCKRGGQLTSQLLAVARQSGDHKAAVNGRELLQDIASLLERTLPHSIRLELDLAEDLPTLHADRSRLHSAVLNLALNARDAMSGGGVLALRSWVEREAQSPAQWLVQVSDTGLGISAEVQEKVFEPFFTTKEVGQGTGLGLSLVYATAEEMGGSIQVDSSPGSGSVFTLQLPLGEVPEVSAALRGAELGEHPFSTGWLLVVEDEVPVAQMVVHVLQSKGYRVLSADTGPLALEVLQEHQGEVALVLLDLLLPGLGADSLYRLLRSVAPHLPVLFTTGRPDLARRLDANAPLLAKPFTDEELLAAVAAVLSPRVMRGTG